MEEDNDIPSAQDLHDIASKVAMEKKTVAEEKAREIGKELLPELLNLARDAAIKGEFSVLLHKEYIEKVDHCSDELEEWLVKEIDEINAKADGVSYAIRLTNALSHSFTCKLDWSKRDTCDCYKKYAVIQVLSSYYYV